MTQMGRLEGGCWRAGCRLPSRTSMARAPGLRVPVHLRTPRVCSWGTEAAACVRVVLRGGTVPSTHLSDVVQQPLLGLVDGDGGGGVPRQHVHKALGHAQALHLSADLGRKTNARGGGAGRTGGRRG